MPRRICSAAYLVCCFPLRQDLGLASACELTSQVQLWHTEAAGSDWPLMNPDSQQVGMLERSNFHYVVVYHKGNDEDPK